METTWNPAIEHIEGKLCDKGLMKETFDDEKNDLVRKLTSKGKSNAEELLKNPTWMKAYLKLAYEQFSKYPEGVRKILWKNLAKQLKDLKEKEKSQ